RVEVLVQSLQVGQVRGVQILNYAGVDLRQRAEANDNAYQDNHREIGLVLLHPRIAKRQYLVGCGGQAHDPSPMQRSRLVHVTLGQFEFDLSLKAGVRSSAHGTLLIYATRSMPSLASSSNSIMTSLPLA